MEYITQQGTRILYNIAEKNCHIANSAEIFDDADKIDFINFLLTTYPLFTSRSLNSYKWEWKAHNILYKSHFKPEHTKEADLNIDESWWRRFGYFLICLFCRE